jgi:hypothetical protein
MLGMTAFEVRDPMLLVVLMESDDSARRHVRRSGPGRISM